MGSHSFSRGSSWPRDRTHVSCNAGRFFTIRATRKALLLRVSLNYSQAELSSADILWLQEPNIPVLMCPILLTGKENLPESIKSTSLHGSLLWESLCLQKCGLLPEQHSYFSWWKGERKNDQGLLQIGNRRDTDISWPYLGNLETR